jgi:hypothetical protein
MPNQAPRAFYGWSVISCCTNNTNRFFERHTAQIADRLDLFGLLHGEALTGDGHSAGDVFRAHPPRAVGQLPFSANGCGYVGKCLDLELVCLLEP